MVKLMRVNILTANGNDEKKLHPSCCNFHSVLCQFWSRKWTLEISPFEAENAPEYTKSHLKFQKFSGVTPPDPRNWGLRPQTPDRVPLLWLTQLSDSSRAPVRWRLVGRQSNTLLQKALSRDAITEGGATATTSVSTETGHKQDSASNIENDRCAIGKH